MMIPSPCAGGPDAAAAALDRAPRSDGGDGGDASATEGRTVAASPDVVVTLSQGVPAPSTYDAAGRMSGAPTLDDLGANGPGSLARAMESPGADEESPGTSQLERA